MHRSSSCRPPFPVPQPPIAHPTPICTICRRPYEHVLRRARGPRPPVAPRGPRAPRTRPAQPPGRPAATAAAPATAPRAARRQSPGRGSRGTRGGAAPARQPPAAAAGPGGGWGAYIRRSGMGQQRWRSGLRPAPRPEPSSPACRRAGEPVQSVSFLKSALLHRIALTLPRIHLQVGQLRRRGPADLPQRGRLLRDVARREHPFDWPRIQDPTRTPF
jgi:hypothetical protein